MPCDRSGISQKTATDPATSYSGGTIPAGINSQRTACSLVPAIRSSSEPMRETLFSHGVSLDTAPMVRPASNAPCSETKARTNRPSLSDRLTPLLISSGLVAGITPLSIRRKSGAAIRDFASLPLVGGGAGSRRAGCSSLNEIHSGASVPNRAGAATW